MSVSPKAPQLRPPQGVRNPSVWRRESARGQLEDHRDERRRGVQGADRGRMQPGQSGIAVRDRGSGGMTTALRGGGG